MHVKHTNPDDDFLLPRGSMFQPHSDDLHLLLHLSQNTNIITYQQHDDDTKHIMNLCTTIITMKMHAQQHESSPSSPSV